MFESGGALCAYQVGVYLALHESGIEPNREIATSIGAINAALIGGNRPERRMERIEAFWKLVQLPAAPWHEDMPWTRSAMNLNMLMRGVPGSFKPNPRDGE